MKMKSMRNLMLFAAASFFAVACTSAPDSDEAQVGDAKEVTDASAEAVAYAVDTDASLIEWIGTKTNGRHNGVLNLASGTLQVKDGTIEGGEFAMDMNSMLSTDKAMDEENNMKLTGHLKSADFFKVEEFPTATFVLTGVEAATQPVEENPEENTEEIDQYRVTNPTHMISGNLTIREVTKGITFPAKVEMTENGIMAIAKFNIDRKDWNLDYEIAAADIILNNTIHLGINLVANKPAA